MVYDALETGQLTLEGPVAPHPQPEAPPGSADCIPGRSGAPSGQRRVELSGTEEIKEYVADFRTFLELGTFPERKALIRNFVQGIEVVGDEATLTYTIPMPSDVGS